MSSSTEFVGVQNIFCRCKITENWAKHDTISSLFLNNLPPQIFCISRPYLNKDDKCRFPKLRVRHVIGNCSDELHWQDLGELLALHSFDTYSKNVRFIKRSFVHFSTCIRKLFKGVLRQSHVTTFTSSRTEDTLRSCLL